MRAGYSTGQVLIVDGGDAGVATDFPKIAPRRAHNGPPRRFALRRVVVMALVLTLSLST